MEVTASRRTMPGGYISLVGYCLLGTILAAQSAISAASSPPSPFGLMSAAVMLNPDLLEMLRNGGFDTRQPARIFLPPKFYSSIVYDSGHRSPEEVFRTNLELMMEAAYGSDGANRRLTSPLTATATRQQQQQQPNLISYSNVGTGNRNKGSGALEKNTVTNFKSSLPAAASASLAPSTSSASSIVPTDRNRSGGIGGRIASPGTSRGGQDGYNLRSTLPGEPDVDYPILGHIPETSFKCLGRNDGYYADVEARCQVFRVCANTDASGNGFAFLCPNGTLFNQQYFVCDWYMNVRCGESEKFYAKNEQLGKNTADFGKMMASVMSMVSFPMMTSLLAAGGSTASGVGQGEGNRLDIANVQLAKRANVVDSGFEGGNPAARGQGVQSSAKGGKSDVFQSKFNKGTTYGTRGGVEAQKPSQLVPPRVSEQVYVSSLGTLSTDPQSGFDPSKSAFLGAPIGRDLLPPKKEKIIRPTPPAGAQRHRLNEEIQSLPIPDAEVKIIMAKLLKMWTDVGYAKMPSPSYQPIAPILPPSGVLPPSTVTSVNSRRILTKAVPNSQIIHTNQVPHNPNPVTVQNVYRVNKAFVTPEVYYPKPSYFVPATNTVTRIGLARNPNTLPAAAPQLVSRRNDILVQPVSYSAGSRGTGYEIEVVPAVSYYLTSNQPRQYNNRRGHQRAFVTPNVFQGYNGGFSSYNVPIGSIGPYYVVNN